MSKCLQCGIETTNPKFCSRSCSTCYNNTKSPKRQRVEYICENCNKGYYKTSSSPQRFCSIKCRQEYRLNNGEMISPQAIKPILLKQRDNKCEICGRFAEWQNKPLTLIIDHIDGNSDNNLPDNLRLICPNCDSQLPTYKAKNTGNGRHKRRQRYADGKSY